MAFKEEAEVAYTIINGKKVPVVKCETEVVLRNTRTNVENHSELAPSGGIAATLIFNDLVISSLIVGVFESAISSSAS